MRMELWNIRKGLDACRIFVNVYNFWILLTGPLTTPTKQAFPFILSSDAIAQTVTSSCISKMAYGTDTSLSAPASICSSHYRRTMEHNWAATPCYSTDNQFAAVVTGTRYKKLPSAPSLPILYFTYSVVSASVPVKFQHWELRNFLLCFYTFILLPHHKNRQLQCNVLLGSIISMGHEVPLLIPI